MNPDLDLLQPYPFEKLARLKAGLHAPANVQHISLSIGEPKHAPPEFVLRALQDNLSRIANYPNSKGLPELRQTIAEWLQRRFLLPQGSVDGERHVLPVSGTREALFAFAQAVIDRSYKPLVLMPNPFYQIYEGAALLAGAEPGFLNCTADNNYRPDFAAVSADTWQRCQLLYICSPGNPTGTVIDTAQLQALVQLADEHDFIIASDECYSELYFDEASPPPGLLQACAEMGRLDFSRCVVFHSLSKRSNLPGLRSGFVAGDAAILEKFLLYRTYHGCAMSISNQLASIAAWQDECHVRANRDAYRAKFDSVLRILDGHLKVARPDASFYLWPSIDGSDEEFAARLFVEQNITVLPGRYIARCANGINPGASGIHPGASGINPGASDINPGEGHVRMALVATLAECREAAERMRDFLQRG